MNFYQLSVNYCYASFHYFALFNSDNFMRQAPQSPFWFDVAKYSRARTLNFRDWATQIGNRNYLSTLLDIGKLDEFDERFKVLMEDPFADLGFSASFPSDRTLYPLTLGVAKTFVGLLTDEKCVDKDVCDEKLREIHPDIYDGQGHLFVNLRAPKSLLIKKFGDWLDESLLKRARGPAITESVIQFWAVSHPILPYQDLMLWHTRHEKTMPSDFDMARWLGQDRQAARAAREKAEVVFTLDYYFNLKFSASASEKVI